MVAIVAIWRHMPSVASMPAKLRLGDDHDKNQYEYFQEKFYYDDFISG